MNNESAERAKVIRLLLALTFLLTGYFISRYAYGTGQLSIEGLSGNETVVSIQGENLNNSFTTSSTTYSSRLPSGKYTVTIKDGLTSQLKTVSIGRFFSKETIAVVLSEESKREFIAENPRSCLTEVRGLIASYTCNGPASGLAVHLPAAINTAPSIATLKKSIDSTNQVNSQLGIEAIEEIIEEPGSIEAAVKVNDKTFLLLYLSNERGVYHTVYELSLVNNAPVIAFVKSLDGLGNDLYQANYYDGQLVLSNQDGSKVATGTSFDDLTLVRDVTKNDANFSSYRNGTLFQVFIETEKGAQDFDLSKGSSILTLEMDGESKNLTIDKEVLKAGFCSDLLCVLNDDNSLHVYDESLKQLAIIPGVEDYKTSNNLVYLLKNDSVVSYDPVLQEGYTIYSSDTFALSDFTIYNDELYITVDSGKKQHLLKASQQAPDYIDRAISVLIKNGFINTLSLYKNFIFIVPELGERVQTEDGTYEYDETVKNAARDSINASLSEITGLSIDYNVRVFVL